MNEKKTLLDTLRETAEALDWCWHADDDDEGVELEKYSPAGEDFFIYVTKDGFLRDVYDRWQDFDPEDHVLDLLMAKRNGFAGVPDLKTLVQDADDIDSMLEELYDALYEAEENWNIENDDEEDEEE